MNATRSVHEHEPMDRSDRSRSSRLLLIATLLAAASTVILWVFAITRYPKLPALIPLHFNGLGEAYRWETKTPMSWYQLPGIATAIIAGLVGVAWFTRWAAMRTPSLVRIRRPGRLLPEPSARRAWIVEPFAAALALDGVMVGGLFLILLQGIERIANGAWLTLSPMWLLIQVIPICMALIGGVFLTFCRAANA